jgi:hypothetical protein
MYFEGRNAERMFNVSGCTIVRNVIYVEIITKLKTNFRVNFINLGISNFSLQFSEMGNKNSKNEENKRRDIH